MRGTIFLALTGLAFLGTSSAAQADDAKAVIEKAIKALGGEKQVERLQTARIKFKGSFELNGKEAPVTGQLLLHLPGKYRLQHEMELNNNKINLIYVLNGDEGWLKLNDNTSQLNEADFEYTRDALSYLNFDALLPQLLKDNKYKLTAVAETKVNGKPAAGVKVSTTGKKDVTLFFDKETGLLVKSEREGLDNSLKKDANWETYFSDYKEQGGIMRFTKVRITHDSIKYFEAEATEIKVAESIDDNEFTRP